MGLLDSLRIGTSALLTQQAALQVTGNNIANVSTPGYARQDPILASSGTSRYGSGITGGAGVKLADVRRIVDDALQQRVNDAYSQTNQYQVAEQTLARVESLLNEGTATDLSSALSRLFNGFSQLVQNPESVSQRGLVINQAQTVVTELHRLSSGLQDFSQELTSRLSADVTEADRLASAIADLNTQIVSAESGGATAASLRDERDMAINQLSKLIGVSAREQPNGAVTIYMGSEPLVYQGDSRGLALVSREVNGQVEQVVSFADNEGPVLLLGGQIAGLQATRDGELAQVSDRLDSLAEQLIWQVNRIHSGGTGLEGVRSVTSVYQVADGAAELCTADAGLNFATVNGSFQITVTSAPQGVTPTSSTTTIEVKQYGDGTGMSLSDLAAAMNTVPGVSASVGVSGRLTISATDPDATLSFGQDHSGVLAALGINTFFTGVDAGSIAVHPEIADHASRMALGLTGAAGDGDNAKALAALGDTSTKFQALGNLSLGEYHQRISSDLAVWTAAARDTATANQVVHESLAAQRDSLSGVSMDEEAVNLMQYQRAFQGAARFITVVDEMLQTLLDIAS